VNQIQYSSMGELLFRNIFKEAIKIKTQPDACLPCMHFGFCADNWGKNCKRQGGDKIPRMKSNGVKLKSKAIKQVPKNGAKMGKYQAILLRNIIRYILKW